MSDGIPGDAGYHNKWVAEVSVIHPNGDAIRRYLQLKNLQLKILNQKQLYLKHKHETLDLDDSTRSMLVSCHGPHFLSPSPP